MLFARAIFTSTDETPDSIWLKGGLFAKLGTPIPRATIELYVRNREAWERATDGVPGLEGFLPEEPRSSL
jgi:hypothetical protein